jgi:hypothetical protein
MNKKLPATFLLTIALIVGIGAATVLPASAHASTSTHSMIPYYSCSWILKQRDYPTYLNPNYQMIVTVYEYRDVSGGYCGNWKSIDSITVLAGAGGGTYWAAVWDGSRHLGPSFSWNQQTYNQSRTLTAYYNTDACVKGDGYLSTAGNKLDNLNTYWGCP